MITIDLHDLAARSPADRRAALDHAWASAPAEDPTQHAATLAVLVRLALGGEAVEWAADLLVGPAVTGLRRSDPALLEQLAGETLAAGGATPMHGVVLNDLRAAHWFEAGQLQRAVELYAAAVAVARELGEPRVLCHALNNLGNALAVSDGNAAEACFGEAIELARGSGAVDQELISLNNLCVTRMDAGDFDRAGEAFDFAIRRVDETGRWKSFGNVIVGNLGTLYARSGSRTLADTFLRRAIEVATAAGDHELSVAWSAQLTPEPS